MHILFRRPVFLQSVPPARICHKPRAPIPVVPRFPLTHWRVFRTKFCYNTNICVRSNHLQGALLTLFLYVFVYVQLSFESKCGHLRLYLCSTAIRKTIDGYEKQYVALLIVQDERKLEYSRLIEIIATLVISFGS